MVHWVCVKLYYIRFCNMFAAGFKRLIAFVQVTVQRKIPRKPTRSFGIEIQSCTCSCMCKKKKGKKKGIQPMQQYSTSEQGELNYKLHEKRNKWHT